MNFFTKKKEVVKTQVTSIVINDPALARELRKMLTEANSMDLKVHIEWDAIEISPKGRR